MMRPEKLTTEKLYALIEKEFHDHNKLWGEVATAYADSGLKLFDDTIRFVYQALTAMGFIAGFGFAGIQGVKTIILFISGEAIMFMALMYGFYKIKYIYTKNADSVEETSQRIKEVYEKKSIALGEMMKELRTIGKLDEKNHVVDYESANKEILKLHGIGEARKRDKDQSWFITFMIGVFAIGFMLLLLSFVPPLSINSNP